MNVLALDTCSAACSAALLCGETVTERYVLERTGHARLLLPMIDELLAEADLRPRQLDLVACTRGPGAFTGVRIGVAAAQGVAFAADVPVAPVSSLQVLAQGAIVETGAADVAVAVDARMGELYWCTCGADAAGRAELREAERVCAPAALGPLPDGIWLGVGDGWRAHADALASSLGCVVNVCEDRLYPHARDLLPLAKRAWDESECVPPARAQPVYLRDKVADKPRTS